MLAAVCSQQPVIAAAVVIKGVAAGSEFIFCKVQHAIEDLVTAGNVGDPDFGSATRFTHGAEAAELVIALGFERTPLCQESSQLRTGR